MTRRNIRSSIPANIISHIMRHNHSDSLRAAMFLVALICGFAFTSAGTPSAKRTDFSVDAPHQVSFSAGDYIGGARPAAAQEIGINRKLSQQTSATASSPPPPYQPIGTVMDRVMTSPTWSLLATAIDTLLPDDVRAFLNTAMHAYTLFGPDDDAFEATRLALGLPNMEALMSHPLLPPVLMTHISLVLHTSSTDQLVNGQFISTLSPSGWTLKVRLMMKQVTLVSVNSSFLLVWHDFLQSQNSQL